MSFPNLFITEEDIVWIDQNIFENPDKEEDFRKVKFTEAQQDAFKKQEPDWKARFPSEHRWIGQLGEAAFKKYMTVHERELQDFTKNGASWVDFFYPKRTMKIDVKTIFSFLLTDLYSLE